MVKNILFICKDDPELDSAHIFRSIALAEYLRRKSRIYNIKFLCHENALPLLKEKYFDCEKKMPSLLKQILKNRPSIIIMDNYCTRTHLVKRLKDIKVPLVNLSYEDPSRHVCDAKISCLMTENAFKPSYHEGYDYVLLPKEFFCDQFTIRRRATKLFVYVKNKETHEIIKKITSEFNFEITYLFPKDMKQESGIKFTDNLSSILKEHDLAIVPVDFMFKCMAVGLPTIVIANNEAEAQFASKLINSEAVVYLGRYDSINPDVAIKNIKILCNGMAWRTRLSFCSKKLVNRQSHDNVYEIFRSVIG